MKVIVTGSNGFIGGHVSDYLRQNGIYVIGLGRHISPVHEVDEYISCDLSADDATDILNDLVSPDTDSIIHLAADMRHEPYTVNVVTANCGGTQRLLEFCENRRMRSFIQLSSLPVIGKPIQHPITEKHSIYPPTVYHVTKHTQELLANYAWYTHGLRTVSFRISAPVGVGMNPKTIVPVFIKNAVDNRDLILSGQGTRMQTYIHVKDIAQAIHKALLSNAQGVYNLASHNLISNYELARKCIAVAHSKSNIVFSGQNDPMDDYTWDVSLDNIKSDIGYSPEIDMEYAIQELVEYYRRNGCI